MLSIVIPVYNEVESLHLLHGELTAAATKLNEPYEIWFIDDGSRDGSWKVVQELAQTDSHVQGVRFRRNFGKAAALRAGFERVQGTWVMTLDADLQDDPAEIPRFRDKLAEDLDVVSGFKQTRHDPWHKVYPSRIFNWMVSKLTGVELHDHNCGMKCYRREVVQEVRLYGELHRFVPVLAAARGFRVGEIVINHRRRKFGQSKYGVRRFLKGFLDLLTVTFLTGFGGRPQHLLGGLGLCSLGLGAVGMFYLTLYWFYTQLFPSPTLAPLHDRPLLLYSVAALLVGAQFWSVGLLAELITSYQLRNEDAFSIVDQTPPRTATPDHHSA